jgi:hypothetical protein
MSGSMPAVIFGQANHPCSLCREVRRGERYRMTGMVERNGKTCRGW